MSRIRHPLNVLILLGDDADPTSIIDTLDRLTRLENVDAGTQFPRDTFDIIGGVPITGAWIAMLLGRYSFNLTVCKQELCTFLNILSKNCAFTHEDTLIWFIEELNEKYQLSKWFMVPDLGRCKNVFITAGRPSTADISTKSLTLRSYNGSSPIDTKTVFVVSGTAQREDCDFNVLAIEEAQDIYGRDVPISLVVQINSGITTHSTPNNSPQAAEQRIRITPLGQNGKVVTIFPKTVDEEQKEKDECLKAGKPYTPWLEEPEVKKAFSEIRERLLNPPALEGWATM